MSGGREGIPSAARSDVGRRRDHNEDAVHVEMPLLVVADGVGGSAKGEVASRLAIDTFVAAAAEVLGARSSDDAVRAMEHAVVAANAAVHESQLRDESRRGMATTLTAAVVRDGGEVVVGHVGDSRLYVLSAAGARQLTDDHSVVAELVRSGRLAAEDVPTHPQRNVITRALGPEPDLTVDAFIAHVGPGDWLLACSDGLTEHVADLELARIVVEHTADPDRAAEELVALANERGGTDNITVALAQPVPSDVSGELRIETLRAAIAHADESGRTDALPVVSSTAPAEDSGPLPAIVPEGATAAETSGELPVLQPVPGAEDWQDEDVDDDAELRSLRAWIVALVLLVVVLLVVGFTWSRSYFLTERADGTVGIDRGFPVAGLATQYRDSEVLADDLDPADRERLVESHRILSESDARQVLLDLPTRLDAVDSPAGQEA